MTTLDRAFLTRPMPNRPPPELTPSGFAASRQSDPQSSVAPPSDPPALFPELTRDDVFLLGTPRLWLRWARATDAPALARIGGDPGVATRTGTWPIGADAAFARDKIANQRARNAAGTGFGFAMVLRQHWEQPIGLVGFNVVADADRPTLAGGYHLDPACWGRGLMSEALAAVLGMVRLLTSIEVAQASVMPDNPASIAVLIKAGFVRRGSGSLTTPECGTFAVEQFELELHRRGT